MRQRIAVRYWRREILVRAVCVAASVVVVAHYVAAGNRIVADIDAATMCVMGFALVRAFRFYREAKRDLLRARD